MKHSRKSDRGDDLDRHQSLVGSSLLNLVDNEHVVGHEIVFQDLQVGIKAIKSLKEDPLKTINQLNQSKMTTLCLRYSPRPRIFSSKISLK